MPYRYPLFLFPCPLSLFQIIFLEVEMLYLFVTVFENGKLLLQENAISIESDKYFDDVLKKALYIKSVDKYITIKVDFQIGRSDQ